MQAIAIILLSLLCLDSALAAAGRLVFVSGPVSIERAPPVVARAGDSVDQGDVVVTGDKARAQLLMNDGARIALRSGSRFRIDEFSLPAAVTAPVQATTANASGKAVASLLKGGFRTTSGAIGKNDPSAYAVRTPVGTLGIRGTRYVAVWCAGDCRDAPGLTAGEVIRDGLYLGVEEGVVVFQFGGREFRLTAGQVMFFPAGGGEPELLDRQPAWLEQDGAGSFQLAGGGRGGKASAASLPGVNERRSPSGLDDDQSTGEQPPAADPSVDQQIQGTFQGETIDLTPGGPRPQSAERRDLGWSVANLPNVPGGFSNGEDLPATGYALDANGNLVRFAGELPTGSVPLAATYDVGTATLVDTGASAAAGVRWGRWSGGDMGVNVNGTPTTVNLGQQSLHWILSGNADVAPVLPITGSVTYVLAGGTNPTDNLGNTGTLGSANLVADFTSNTVGTTLNVTVAGNDWVASGIGVIGAQAGLPAHQFGGIYDTVQINPVQGTGTGTFSGFFSGPATGSGGSPAGAGLSFNLVDDLGLSQVNGTAALIAP
jgi:FecR protein